MRYLDLNDSYLAKGETCHPSDNLAPVLSAAEDAVARLDEIPVSELTHLLAQLPSPREAAGEEQGWRGSPATDESTHARS